MFPPQAPWSGLGQLESKIESLRRDINNKANSYDVTSLNNRLNDLEYSISEIRSEISGLEYRISNIELSRAEMEDS